MGSSPDEVIQALGRRPGLRFKLARSLAQMKIVSGWIGPVATTLPKDPSTGRPMLVSAQHWRREDVGGNTVAAIHLDGEPLDTGEPPPYEWAACPALITSFDGTKGISYEHGGAEADLDVAKAEADRKLVAEDYTLTRGPGLFAGPWSEKTNHHCRDIISGSRRQPGMNDKLAVIRAKKMVGAEPGGKAMATHIQWQWGILDRANDNDVTVGGSAESLERAKEMVDKQLKRNGWGLDDGDTG